MQAQNEKQNTLRTHIREENGKYGLAHANSDWLVKAEFDTVFERRVFPYRVPGEAGQEAASGNIVFVLMNYPEGRYWREVEFNSREVEVELRKINGEKIGDGKYDGYEFLDDVHWTSEKTSYTNQAIVLHEKGSRTLVEPGFTTTKTPWKSIELYTDLQLYLVEKADGNFALVDKRKEEKLVAKHIKPLIYTANFIGLSLKHEVGATQVNLPYFVVTHSNGEKQLFSALKNDYVTPRLSAAAEQDLSLDLDLKNPQGIVIEYRYFDKGLGGVYHSNYKTGTACIYKQMDFIWEDKSLLRVQLEGENFERLVEMSDPSVSYEFDELIEQGMDYWKGRNGLILKFNGKYRGFMGTKITAYYDELAVNSSLKSMFTYKTEGKYGATNGEVTIPALFPEEIKFSYPLKHPLYDFIYTSQKLDKVYFDSRGNQRLTKKGLLDIRKTDKGDFIIVEYYEDDDSKFLQTHAESYKNIQTTSYPTIFLATDKKGKWGMVDAFGKIYLPFAYDRIEEMDQISNDISLFEVYQGKNRAIFNFRYGIVTPFSPAIYSLVKLVDETYFLELWTKQGKKMHYGLYTVTGKEIFPLQEAYESLSFTTQNERNTLLGRVRKDIEAVWITKEAFPQILGKNEFFYADEHYGYKKDALKQEMEAYSLKSGLLEKILSYEQFAMNLGHYVTRDGTAYVLHFTNMQMDTPVAMEIRLDSLDFIIDDVPQLIGKKGKKWKIYNPYESELPYFEKAYVPKK